MKRLLILVMMISCLSLVASAQNNFEMPPESGRAFALSVTETGIQLGEFEQNFGGTIDIDYNPADPRRWARADNFGMLRFVDIGNPDIVEGTYTFSPFFEGFEASSAVENKYFVQAVEWSPDGRMLAFYIENASIRELDQGLWFWQPMRELSTDPAYQLLRPCPNFCSASGVAGDYEGWDVLGFEWSSDNSALLVTTTAYEFGRRALTIRFAQRVDPPPATVAPTFLQYDYGHWSSNGQQIIVSGTGPEDTVLFGRVDRSGANPIVSLASDIGMAWVQDAVQLSDDTLVMLGSRINATAPLQLIDQDGTALTPPIGDAAPDNVAWSPDKTAVRLDIGDAVYVASIDGTVYDITTQIAGSPNIDWVNGALPATFIPIPLLAPIASGEVVIEVTEDTSQVFEVAVGDLLVVTGGVVDIYSEPVAGSTVIGSLVVGNELIITDGPLQSEESIWYRVQTLDFTGWINNTSLLNYPDN
ncbi:MAG: SH3 domain-containing protein [Phototrophicaceae bacterium]